MNQSAESVPGYKTPMSVAWEFDYNVKIDQLRNLYEKAKELQWNAETDITGERPREAGARRDPTFLAVLENTGIDPVDFAKGIQEAREAGIQLDQ